MASESEAPSPEEVRRRVNNLYDRAESDTGTFNATRALAIPRQRGAAVQSRSEDEMEPAVGSFARQWFDAARAKFGPSVPAWHAQRKAPVRPDRAPQKARPVRPAERPEELRALEAPKASTGGALELTAGSVPAPAPATELLPELPGPRTAEAAEGELRPVASAPAAEAPSAFDGDGAPWSLYEPAPTPVPAAPAPGPAWESGPQLTAPYAASPSLDPTAFYSDGRSVEVTAPYSEVGLPDIPAPWPAATALAEAATEPVTASAPAALAVAAAPPAPESLAAHQPPSTTYTPGDFAGSWPVPAGGHSTQAERVIVFARAQIGRPCVWGAVGPGSYDAPGLTQAAWKAVGVMLPRSTQAQWGAGVQVSLADVQVGDLVFFHDDLSHVGIWSGDGMMIHAPGPGALICEESVFFAGQAAIKGAIRPV
ncbi:C40 family peptidase [Streptomyces sp. NPDC007907]|uniref:C40 family peptidase n=1 Tax=Streptomyces sp. NPDC007907 TaxID=3364789 RepID=UPI0036EE00E5